MMARIIVSVAGNLTQASTGRAASKPFAQDLCVAAARARRLCRALDG